MTLPRTSLEQNCVTSKDDDAKEWLVKVPGLKVMKGSPLACCPCVAYVLEEE